MLPTPKNYAIWPAVVPADQPTEMTIVPCEKAFLLFEGETYELKLIDVNGDEVDYHAPHSHKKMSVVAHDGVLRFSYTFEGEQEHLILLYHQGKLKQSFSVYSLFEDLYRLRPFKGDLHSHSYRSDGNRDPAALAGHYREQGYDFSALTDHNRFYPGEEIDETYEGIRMGYTRVTGEEVHAPGSVLHIVHAGGKSSVAELYLNDREGYEQAIDAYRKKVPAHIPENYHDRYAMAMWVVDRIHDAGGIAIFAHPYWAPGGSCMYNVCDEFTRILLMSGMFDAFELMGGGGQVNRNRTVTIWADLRAEGLKIPVVGSSDVHSLQNCGTYPYLFTICFAEKNTNDSLIASIRDGMCVSVECNHHSGPEQYQYRCYGSLRLCSYAQFLLSHYFPARQRICQGEGVAMRQFTVGEADAGLVERLAAQSRDFSDRFFGAKPPVLPTPAMIAFENKWRERQLQGPVTKGSVAYSEVVNRQI